jgi:hypothetical protein
MHDREVSATVVASSALWVVSAGLMIAGFWDLRFMGWGLWGAAIAATCTIRKMICQSDARSRNAFDLGRDYDRSAEASVRSLR